MTIHQPANEVEATKSKKIRCVAEFARRYRLHQEEQSRLLKLLGPMATEQELLMNARRVLNIR